MGKDRERIFYIDNIRLLAIVLVVMHHIAITYSGGMWYYNENATAALDVVTRSFFGFYLSFVQAFFMGLLFLIAGYFTPSAYDNKGFSKFIKDRFIRLCVPALIYMFVINPFIWFIELRPYWADPGRGFFEFYSGYLTRGYVLDGSGPLWFALALFIFTLAYGLVRLVIKRRERTREISPGFNKLLALILIIAVFAFLIRLVFPTGKTVFNMQLGYFAQYIVLFIVGAVSYRNNIFEKLDAGQGRWWLFAALVPGFGFWGFIMMLGGSLNDYTPYTGGVTWQSAAFAVWESFTAVAVSAGLITLFREKYNYQSSLIGAASKSAFAVYVFHPPVIIAVTLLAAPLALPPVIKFLAMSVVCVPVCFAASHFIFRKIPLLKRVL